MGTYSQMEWSNSSMPRRLTLCALFAAMSLAQQPASKFSFEVVSVRPAVPQPMSQTRIPRSSDPGRVRFDAFSLRDYIRTAYRVKDFQVQGPEWIEITRFDVVGKLPEGTTQGQVPEMLQSMLAERFHLAVHRETKEHAVLALVAGKGGPKLKSSEVDGEPMPGSGTMPRGGMRIQMDNQGAHLTGTGVTLANLAEMISRFAERPVVDMSGIAGEYDFDLLISPAAFRAGRGVMIMSPSGESSRGPSDAAAEGQGSLQEAVRKYGLQLEPRKARMDMVVVDRIEKTPTEN